MPSNMKSEGNRLWTLNTRGWNHIHPSAEQVAYAGFYFPDNTETLRCPFCGVVICRNDYSEGFDPVKLHHWKSEDCPHIVAVRKYQEAEAAKVKARAKAKDKKNKA